MKRKTLQELNLIDDFLFTEAMSDPLFAKPFASLIIDRVLGVKPDQINVEIQPQKIIQGISPDKHGICMDVAISTKTPAGTCAKVYDIEPNSYTDNNLPRRSRFYQALQDVKFLQANTDYSMLPDLCQIWILSYDIFGYNHMIYSIKKTVEGLDNIVYNDGIQKIFLYVDGSLGGNEKLKNMLVYLKNSIASNATDTELANLHENIETIKQRTEVGVRYMRMWDVMNEEKKIARAEGLAVGREEGLAVGREEGLAAGREEGLAAGREEGLEIGLAEGRAEGRKESYEAIVTSMLNDNAPIEKIMLYSGLSEDEILAIKNNN